MLLVAVRGSGAVLLWSSWSPRVPRAVGILLVAATDRAPNLLVALAALKAVPGLLAWWPPPWREDGLPTAER